MIRDGGSTPAERIAYGFRRVLGRKPSGEELKLLSAGFQRRLREFEADPKAARALLSHGASADAKAAAKVTSKDKDTPQPDLTPERAAYATVANVLLNLDEFVTRE
jgi:hypothetical protein